MGIAGFNKWLLATFPEIVKVQGNKFRQVYDHVAFDINQILHQAARKASSRPALAAAVFRELDQILNNCVPRKSVYFAFDGPGPLAKLMTQRKRRVRARTDHVAPTHVVKGSSRRSRRAEPAISRLELTPGVDTLYYIRDAVEYWAFSRLQKDPKLLSVSIRISGPDVPGEGELKIIDFCRASRLPSTESVVVVGGDADIVLQGLATTPLRNFFVYLRHFQGLGSRRMNYVLSVWELSRTLEKLFPGESLGVRLDVILISVLNGNDYIPKVRGVTFSRLWRRYIRLKTVPDADGRQPPFAGQCVIDGERRTFNWPFLHALVDEVGARVPSLSDAVVARNVLLPAANTSSMGNGVETVEEGCELDEEIVYTGNENGVPLKEFEVNWAFDIENDGDDVENEDEDASDTGSSDISESQDEEDPIDTDDAHLQTLVSLSGDEKKFYDTERWLRTILWTIHMYVDGYCSDYAFQYGKPYGPSCEVISRFIQDHNGDPFKLEAPISNAAPLLPHEAAIAMLPKTASHLLPKPLRDVVLSPAISKKIFLANDIVNVTELLNAVARIPKSAYTIEELRLTQRGEPVLLRLVRTGDKSARQNPVIKKPGPRFQDIARYPVVLRHSLQGTSTPPCYPWPHGAASNMLNLSYKIVGGMELRKQLSKLTSVPANAVKRSPGGTTTKRHSASRRKTTTRRAREGRRTRNNDGPQ